MGSVRLVLKRKVNRVGVFAEMSNVPVRVVWTLGELASCPAALYGADGQPARSRRCLATVKVF